MATTQKNSKNTAKKADTKKPAAKQSAAKKPQTKKTEPQKAIPQKRPVRREVWGLVMAFLALCVFVTYLKINGWVIDWFAGIIKGLIGYGYWMMVPALLVAAWVLLFHHGRPVRLRVCCAMLLPVAFSAFAHILDYNLPFEGMKKLWADGRALTSGGFLAGGLAELFSKAFSEIVAGVLFGLLVLVLMFAALHVTPWELIARYRDRVRYEEEELPPAPVKTAEPAKRPAPRKVQIDIPLEDEPVAAIPSVKEKVQPKAEPVVEKEKESRFTGFFRHKSEQQKTPDQVLAEKKTPAAAPVAAPAPVQPAPEPVREIVPPTPVREEPAATPAPAAEAVSGRKDRATTAKEVAAQTAAVAAEIEEKLAATEETYRVPPVTLLHENRSENHVEAGAELRNNSRRLSETLASFGVEATPGDVVHGPAVTRYEYTLDQGVKLSKITNLADDIALALGATGVRIAPIPDKISVVGIEVPNKQVTSVLIRDVIESREFTEHRSNTAFALGRDIGGRNIVGDIERLPHVLIAGTTGSGKSVCTNSLIISLLYKSTPDEVRFIMVDPKMVELAPYNGIPHLLIPVVTDPKKAAGALQWAVFEMMKRYKTFSEHGVKKLEEFNRLAKADETLEPMPSVVVVIDELADLMLVAAKEVEESICRVAQMGRAAGMHLVIATQRPSADVITGLMKANIPSRVAFAVASSLESRIILDTTGAEKLVGKGDMLYAPLGAGKPQRVQGCFISPEEIEDVVQFVKQSGETCYDDEVLAKIEQAVQEKEKGSGGAKAASADVSEDDGDELLPAAVDVVLETGQASVSMLQRRLKLGYSRAARLVDQMEERGIVGPFEGSKPRQLLITRAQWQEMQMGGSAAPAEEADDVPFETEE